MKKLLVIWIPGALLNILLIWYIVLVMGFFDKNLYIPFLWMTINFIPISLLIGYFSYLNKHIISKSIRYLLFLFLVLCLMSLLSRRPLGDLETYEKVMSFAPFFLLPIQAIIIFFLLKLGKLENQLMFFFKSKDRKNIIQLIQKGRTDQALEKLLEESENKNPEVYKFLSLLKNNLVEAKRKYNIGTLDDDKFLQITMKANESLMEFL